MPVLTLGAAEEAVLTGADLVDATLADTTGVDAAELDAAELDATEVATKALLEDAAAALLAPTLALLAPGAGVPDAPIVKSYQSPMIMSTSHYKP